MARDILKTLADEHDEVRSLFDKLKDTTDRAKKTRGDLLDEIEDKPLPHANGKRLCSIRRSRSAPTATACRPMPKPCRNIARSN